MKSIEEGYTKEHVYREVETSMSVKPAMVGRANTDYTTPKSDRHRSSDRILGDLLP